MKSTPGEPIELKHATVEVDTNYTKIHVLNWEGVIGGQKITFSVYFDPPIVVDAQQQYSWKLAVDPTSHDGTDRQG